MSGQFFFFFFFNSSLSPLFAGERGLPGKLVLLLTDAGGFLASALGIHSCGRAGAGLAGGGS